jgi:hypothetical protein
VLLEGMPPVPVRYGSWSEWRRGRSAVLPPAPLVPQGTSFCARCWGAGRIFEQARNGEGLVPVRCEGCDGERAVPG